MTKTEPTPTLPASIPGLLREGSRGWWVSPTGKRKEMQALRIVERGPEWCDGKPSALVVLASYEAEEMAAVEATGDHSMGHVLWNMTWLPLDELVLDLSDPTGRAHAVWKLASRRLHGERPENAAWAAYEADSYGPRWQLIGVSRAVVFGVAWQRKHEHNVPSLASLDPNDPRTLPDGSRWVDAEALRLVCAHVSGLQP